MLNVFSKLWGVLFTLFSAAAAGILIYADILPDDYLKITVAVIAVLFIIFIPFLMLKKLGKVKKIFAVILTTALMAVYGMGVYYVAETIDFYNTISTDSVSTDEFYVIARKDDSAEKLKDIVGKTINVLETEDESYAEAEKLLMKDFDKFIGYEEKSTVETTEGIGNVGLDLIDGKTQYVLISRSHYEILDDHLDGFKEKTKIIHTINVERKYKDFSKKVDVINEPFNVYVTGIDTTGSINNTSRSDVNMVVSVDPISHKLLLTSIPRDTLIKLPSKGNASDKLTHTGIYGPKETIGAVEQLLDTEINYYVKVNFTTVQKVIDIIGGVDVNSDFDFTTHGMEDKFTFHKGINHLNGAQALAFARERKSFPKGDFQRNQHQQIVLEAALDKALSSKTILTQYTSILNAVEDNIAINMPQDNIQKLIKMQLGEMPSWSIEKQCVTGKTGGAVCYSTGSYRVSVVFPSEKSVEKCSKKINEIVKTHSEEEESEEGEK